MSDLRRPDLKQREFLANSVGILLSFHVGSEVDDLRALLRQWENGALHGVDPGAEPFDPDRPHDTQPPIEPNQPKNHGNAK